MVTPARVRPQYLTMRIDRDDPAQGRQRLLENEEVADNGCRRQLLADTILDRHPYSTIGCDSGYPSEVLVCPRPVEGAVIRPQWVRADYVWTADTLDATEVGGTAFGPASVSRCGLHPIEGDPSQRAEQEKRDPVTREVPLKPEATGRAPPVLPTM